MPLTPHAGGGCPGEDHLQLATPAGWRAAADPVGDPPAVLFRCLLPCEVTRVEGVNLAGGEELVGILVVLPRHELVGSALPELGPGRGSPQEGSGRPGPVL